MGIGSKDVEDEASTVEDAAFQSLLHVTGLSGAQLVVDDGDLNVLCLDVLMDLLQLARTKVAHAGWMIHGLHETRHRHTASRLQQKGKLVEVFLRAFTALFLASNGY